VTLPVSFLRRLSPRLIWVQSLERDARSRARRNSIAAGSRRLSGFGRLLDVTPSANLRQKDPVTNVFQWTRS